MPRYNVRIVIPRLTDARALLELAKKIYTKHTTDGATSALHGEVVAKWAAVGPQLSTALQLQDQIEEAEKTLEKLYQNRDLILAAADPVVKQSRDLLVGFYGKAKLRDLGAHGFTVDDTPRPPKAPKTPKP